MYGIYIQERVCNSVGRAAKGAGREQKEHIHVYIYAVAYYVVRCNNPRAARLHFNAIINLTPMRAHKYASLAHSYIDNYYSAISKLIRGDKIDFLSTINFFFLIGIFACVSVYNCTCNNYYCPLLRCGVVNHQWNRSHYEDTTRQNIKR